MSGLGGFERLIQISDRQRRWWNVIAWWELRRLPYNLMVGLAGAAALLLFEWFSRLPPRPVPEPTVNPLAVILFGVGANFFYSAGWVAELIARALWPEKAPKLAPQLLIVGSLLSVMLAVFPGLASFVGWVWRATVA